MIKQIFSPAIVLMRHLSRAHKAGALPVSLCLLLAPLAYGYGEYSVKTSRAAHSLLLDGQCIQEKMVVVGERGHILLSDNGGENWHQATVPTRGNLTGVYFVDSKNGWAVGYYQEILRTDDGGDTWEKVYDNSEDERPLLDVWFQDARQGVAVGAYGLYLVTEDGGDSWASKAMNVTASFAEEEGLSEEEQAFFGAFGADADDFDEELEIGEGDSVCLNQIVRSQTGKLYIAAEIGRLYRSDDQGRTWTSLASPYEGSFFGILPLDGDTLLLLGLRGHLFRSEDGGDSWKEIPTGTTATLLGGTRLTDGRIVITGLEGIVLVSNDDGQSFTLHRHPSRKDILTALAPDGGGLVLVGEFGVKKANGILNTRKSTE